MENTEEEKKQCWVCFATEDDDINEYYQIPISKRTNYKHNWIQPCKCKGTTKWVHQECLKRWIDEKQKGNQSEIVTCPQCKFRYIIILPEAGPLILILEKVDRLIQRLCPFIAAGIIVGTIYWTAVTYGAVTVMQVMGHHQGLDFIESTDPLILLIGLPIIPISLILGKMVRWEDHILDAWRRYSPNWFDNLNQLFYHVTVPYNTFIYDSSSPLNSGGQTYNDEYNHHFADNFESSDGTFNRIDSSLLVDSSDTHSHPTTQQYDALNAAPSLTSPASRVVSSVSAFDNTNNGNIGNDTDDTIPTNVISYDHISTTRVLCGALMLPTIATMLGNVIAPAHIDSKFYRTLIGGLSFIVVKGALRLYYRQTQHTRSLNRAVLNHYSPRPSSNPVTSSYVVPLSATTDSTLGSNNSSDGNARSNSSTGTSLANFITNANTSIQLLLSPQPPAPASQP